LRGGARAVGRLKTRPSAVDWAGPAGSTRASQISDW